MLFVHEKWNVSFIFHVRIFISGGFLFMNLLEVKSISKTYGEGDTAVHALRKVDRKSVV